MAQARERLDPDFAPSLIAKPLKGEALGFLVVHGMGRIYSASVVTPL